jgi:hypothetical protein
MTRLTLRPFAPGCAAKSKFLKRALGLALFATAGARAHVPEIGQIVRFQANALRQEKPMSVTGRLTFGAHKIPYTLHWNGPLDYRITLTKVPGAFTSSSSSPANWVLQRKGRLCALQTANLTVGCPAPEAWAAAELSGSGEEAAAALVDRGFVDADEIVYKETDARTTLKSPKQRNVRLAVGANGSKPIAVIEIRGPGYKSDVPGEEHPVLQFEQTYLKLMLARFARDGEVFTVKATADLGFREKKTRYTALLADRVEVWVGKSLRLVVDRDKILEGQKAQSVPPPKTITDIRTLESQLSPEGLAFLRAFLLVH